MEYISILGDTCFLARRECIYSILPLSIDFYFRRTPHNLSSKIRGEILSEARKYHIGDEVLGNNRAEHLSISLYDGEQALCLLIPSEGFPNIVASAELLL